MRVVTYAEGIRRRFGRGSEQFYSWLQILSAIIVGSIWLNAVSVFVASVFGFDLVLTMCVLGFIVVFNSVLGGAWAVVASDFVQMLVVVTVTIAATFLALAHPQVGGLSGLLEQVPASHFEWSQLANPKIIIFWACAMVLTQSCLINNMAEGGSRFIMVKDHKHARMAVLIPLFCFILFPLIWLVPPMAATITIPDIGAAFPGLKNPSEGAYVGISLQTMPKGLIGLLICGIFAATLSSMDSALNRSAGILVRNLYVGVINPDAPEKRQLIVGRILTLCLGAAMLMMGLYLNNFREADLFNIVLKYLSQLLLPLSVPMLLGLFIRTAPKWSAWSTVIVGLVISQTINKIYNPVWIEKLFNIGQALNEREAGDAQIAVTAFAVVTGCILWYLFSMLFAKNNTPEFNKQVDEFFDDVNRPIDAVAENVPDTDTAQFRAISFICFIYGSFIMLLTLVPNSFGGRLTFIGCGGFVLLVGLFLRKAAIRTETIQAKLEQGN
jgi:Na+/proline symporter